MIGNKAGNKIKNNALYSKPNDDAEIRRKQDRRKKASPGFAYISMVGLDLPPGKNPAKR